MSIMKRDLLLSVEAGKDTCQECDYRREDSCELFMLSLDDEGHRLIKCVEAEEKALEAVIRCAATKAA